MRRKIVHTYWETDYEKVWDGVEYLPTIKQKLDELLKDKERVTPTDKVNPRPKPEDVFKIQKTDKDKRRDRDDDLSR